VPANRNAEVDAWFREKQHPLDAAMQRVRELILNADPRVEESIKWKTPTFSYQGNIVSFNPSKNLVSLRSNGGWRSPGTIPSWRVRATWSGRCASRTWMRSKRRRPSSRW
jgi:Domain of unknown function (DU1801)